MIAALLGLWLTLLLAGDTPAGGLMRGALVEWPAARLARIRRGAVVAWMILGAIGLLCFWFLEEEGLRLFAMALPEIAGWITMFEIGTLVDTILVAAMAASTLRFGAVRHWIAARRPMGRRAKRTRRTRLVARASNDDEDGPAPALAA
ncbi:MAG: hypothetical protein IIZ38_21245 [Sphingomonas sp.]|uniref:hypothetical protein n=1 Tax=unclassified Sphingomonas TaxID=196159 RepID=UPI002455C1E2|nr:MULTISPECIES: hypothetical protein [unclassified Sphingomonas]MBQ1500845.1 hypothetical protein [Sphingomonas sp.]MDH4744593.1 hypothetical protein [Sphingomonas sp. CBMAI 2297]